MIWLEKEIESVVLAMWDEPVEEVVLEVINQFDIDYESALSIVTDIIEKEIENEESAN